MNKAKKPACLLPLVNTRQRATNIAQSRLQAGTFLRVVGLHMSALGNRPKAWHALTGSKSSLQRGTACLRLVQATKDGAERLLCHAR